MAVQAQYPCPVFMVRNNTEDVVVHHQEQQQRDGLSANLVRGYNHPDLVAQNIFNPVAGGGGTVFSEPESELTCNMQTSRKRNRDQLLPFKQQQQMLHPQQQHFMYSKLPKIGQVLDKSAMEEDRLVGSKATSTSGRCSMVSPLLVSQQLQSNLLQQNIEIDALIRLQNEKLRAGLEEARKRHCRALLSVLENNVLKSLQEKEVELANANRRNVQLEEKFKQMSAENEIWFNVAKNNEAIATSLKSSLEQILLQNQCQNNEEGFGDSGDGNVADDAVSYCNQGVVDEEEKTIRENRELKEKRLCKVCHDNDVSVLLLPCRHLCLCKNCETKIEACPICNTLKKASLQIFLS